MIVSFTSQKKRGNMGRNELIRRIFSLKTGECYTVPGGDYGKAEVWCIHKELFVFAISVYGGEPIFHDSYPVTMASAVVDVILSWS